jgi:2-octaprenyl-6-methoxyphenol hydroxylase
MTLKNNIKTDVLIIGGGLSGLTLAALLGRAGVPVTIVDREPPVTKRTKNHDARTTALSYGSCKILEAAGAWNKIEKVSSPMREIRVADGASPLFLHFSSEKDARGAVFGWNLENAHLRQILFKNIQSLKSVRYLAPVEVKNFFNEEESVGVVLKDGRKISAALMVGADGRHSAVRDWLGIGVKMVDYKQTAIVCNIAHALDHENIAVEHFMPAGPFAVLPLLPLSRFAGEGGAQPKAGRVRVPLSHHTLTRPLLTLGHPLPQGGRGKKATYRSSIVWTVQPEEAKRILALSSKDFDRVLQKMCGDHLGRIQHISTPRGYPLSLMHAEDYMAPRVALIADAAHVIHPIAGQGLNLGLRDAALLAKLVIRNMNAGCDIGAGGILKEYAAARRVDTHLMAGFTDLLNRLFSNDLKSVGVLRDIGISIVHNIKPAKRFFVRQAMGVKGSE